MAGITRKDWNVIQGTIEALENYPHLEGIEELTIVLKDTKCTGKIARNEDDEWVFIQQVEKKSDFQLPHAHIPGARSAGTDLTI